MKIDSRAEKRIDQFFTDNLIISFYAKYWVILALFLGGITAGPVYLQFITVFGFVKWLTG